MSHSSILPLIAVSAISFTTWHLVKTHQPVPEVLPPVKPARSPYSATIAGAGLVEPRSENIHVASLVAGTVIEVRVKTGDRVEAGDVLFRLDDRQRNADVSVQQTEVQLSEAELSRWEHFPRPEDVLPGEARVEKARADVDLQQDQYDRTLDLVKHKVVPQQELILRKQSLRAAEASYAEAKAEDARTKAGTWKEDLLISRAKLRRAQELLRQAELEVERLTVRAPISGTVLKINIRPGEFVGAPAGSPLVVMGDIEKLHVRVDIDEQDLPRFQPGLPGQGYVRGDNSTTLPLKFVRVEPFAEPKKMLTNAGGERVDTRVLQVIYSIEGSASVYVGQQLDVFLDSAPPPEASPSYLPLPETSQGTD